MKWSCGGARNAPTPGTAKPASCDSVCPPRLEPPVPRITMSVARSASWRAVSLIVSRSPCVSGRRSNGRLRSAWRARTHSSAPSALAIAAFSVSALTPCDPMLLFARLMDRLVDVHAGNTPYEIVAQKAQRRNQRDTLFRSSARRQPFRPARYRHQQARRCKGAWPPAWHPRSSQRRSGRAALNIVDTEIVDLDLRELRPDLARGVERTARRSL